MRRLLLTGADGFTGRHLSSMAAASGWTVAPLTADLKDPAALREGLDRAGPLDGVIHLAAISAVTHQDALALYQVNVIGTMHLLEALERAPLPAPKVILASSASIYGNATHSPIAESCPPNPLNHYAASKLAMEFMARTHAERLPILITRPFNYTGRGHDQRFVIPKLVHGFATRAPVIELGNLQVEREFNDVRTICAAYLALLEHGLPGETYNLCSGRSMSLQSIIDTLGAITGHEPVIRVNPLFVRSNEVNRLAGDPGKLLGVTGHLSFPPIQDTLKWMLAAE